MPPRAFSLQLPAEAKYAAIAADAAQKFVELMGGAAADGAAFAAALTEALRDAPSAAGPWHCAFSYEPAGVEVVVTAGSASMVVRHPIAAGQR